MSDILRMASREKGIEERDRLTAEVKYYENLIKKTKEKKRKAIEKLDSEVENYEREINKLTARIETIDAVFSDDVDYTYLPAGGE